MRSPVDTGAWSPKPGCGGSIPLGRANARLGKTVKSLGSNPRVSRFESGAAHHWGYSSMVEQPAFNRSIAGPIPRAPTNYAGIV